VRILDQLRNRSRPDEREILVAAPADHEFDAGDIVDFDGLELTEVLLVYPPATSSDLGPGERAVRLDVQGGSRVRGLEGADRALGARPCMPSLAGT
jgi:hypothetical protein